MKCSRCRLGVPSPCLGRCTPINYNAHCLVKYESAAISYHWTDVVELFMKRTENAYESSDRWIRHIWRHYSILFAKFDSTYKTEFKSYCDLIKFDKWEWVIVKRVIVVRMLLLILIILTNRELKSILLAISGTAINDNVYQRRDLVNTHRISTM